MGKESVREGGLEHVCLDGRRGLDAEGGIKGVSDALLLAGANTAGIPSFEATFWEGEEEVDLGVAL